MSRTLEQINQAVTGCSKCPELRAYCAEVAATKRRAFADWEYWGKPVPGFGDSDAWLWIIGLAPAAHGANRTGRMFTGDRSGDFLYAGLHRAGLATQAVATHRGDGLELEGVYISAACNCAPPGNKPSSDQLNRCRAFLVDEWSALDGASVVLALGGIAWDAALKTAREVGVTISRPKPKFGHGAEAVLDDGRRRRTLLGCYHVSQQNTFTGRLTEPMLDAVFARAMELSR
ncbi:MAG: uracil-DNA glycosylase [Phycisphaerales bacterium]